MFDLKVIHSVINQLEEERGIPREKMIDAIEQALGTAYKKEFGKRGQIVRVKFDMATGATEFNQVKIVTDETTVYQDDEELGEDQEKKEATEAAPVLENARVHFDAEKHIMIADARYIKSGVKVGDELVFPLESKDDFGRIAAQTAKQVIIQKIREAEKESALAEFEQKEGDIIVGIVQRFERGNLYVDLGRVTGVMPYDQQIPGERYRPGERVRALLLSVEETPRGIFLKLSRSHPDFITQLFTIETPELQSGVVEVRAIAREAGSRSKIAVFSNDAHIDPVGSLVGQRGVRVSTVMSELGGEKIDIIEWSADPASFIEDALSPAQVVGVTIKSAPDATENQATVEVNADQQSLAIGRGGQNVRLAAKLTNWKIDIISKGAKEEPKTEEKSEDASKEEVSAE
ncbi:transcription termination factor NusA [Patescibacteria group bacterium]|nr:transcription termination factor NusA [Patescibacteria group bacterium]